MPTIGCYRTFAVAAALATISLAAAAQQDCRYLPGDLGWPTKEDWSRLNSTIGGRLIVGTPLASRCHPPHLDPHACAEVQGKWVLTET